jgi:hypothetical protein
LLDLEIEGGVLTTTEDHPFWNATDREFQRADQLDRGDKLLTPSGRLVQVIGIRASSRRVARAYNLSVDGIHTYYVVAGATPVLVHNSNGCGIGNALGDWSSQRFQFGNQQFLLDKSNLTHILERHHPEFWDGSTKASQSFFDKNMSIGDVQNAIGAVLRQNRDTLISRGSRGMYQIQGSYGGADYVLGLNNGHIGQFYPGSLP